MSSVQNFLNTILQASSAMIALSMTVLSVLATFQEKNIDIAYETYNKVIWFMIIMTTTLLWCMGTLLTDAIFPHVEILVKYGSVIVIITAILFVISVILLVYFILKNYQLIRKM
jgi:hypothetical protein